MYAWGDHRRFNSYSGYFRRTFGGRVQKISVDAGFSCPNRDGKIGEGGCTFCNNGAFTPSYCIPAKSIGRQIAEGIEFHGRRYRAASRYLVYFQSFSNTYAPLERLRALYGEALAYPGVAGIVIGTRPDCVDAEKLDYLAEIARDRYVAVEFGIESTCDETLRAVNRGHDFACARRAVEMAAERGLHVGAHFILGLPGETDEMLLEQVATINSLPLTTVKFHQLQVFRGTPMAAQYDADPRRFRFWEVGQYIDLFVEILRRLRPDLVVERFASEAPPRYHYGRNWGLIRNETLLAMLEKDWRSAVHTKAKFLYLCARITNTRRYETHHYGAGAENLQGVLPDDGRHDAVLFCMDRMHHARRRYRRRCHGPFARAVPCRGTLGRHKYPDRYDGFPDQRRAAARGGVHHRMELRREDRVLRLRHIVGAEFWQSVLPEGDFLHLERILSVILGGILAGIGVAICFMQGGSTGGTDIAAMIINKYRTISYGKIVIYSDFVIIGSSMLVGFHIDTVIYGYVMTAVFGYTVDMIMAGNQQSSQVFIVTHDYEKMAQAIVDNIHRGVTLIDSQGWYTKRSRRS